MCELDMKKLAQFPNNGELILYLINKQMETLQLKKDDLKKFDPIQSAIEKYKKEYLPLKINGIDDVEGYKKVDKARKEVKKKRTTVENLRKKLVKPALEWQKSVNDKVKDITSLLKPIEDDLSGKQKVIDDKKAAIEREEENKRQLKIQERIYSLLKYGVTYNGKDYVLDGMIITKKEIIESSDAEFNEIIEEAKSSFERKEAERKAKDEELEKLRQLAKNKSPEESEPQTTSEATKKVLERMKSNKKTTGGSFGTVFKNPSVDGNLSGKDSDKQLLNKINNQFTAFLLQVVSYAEMQTEEGRKIQSMLKGALNETQKLFVTEINNF